MITDGYQKQFYEKMLSDAKIVKCTSVYNILTENEIKKIKGRVRPVYNVRNKSLWWYIL